MSVLSDYEITRLCHGERPMITPFVGYEATRKTGISYGLSSHGYDLRPDGVFWLFHPDVDRRTAPVIDPKNFDRRLVKEYAVDDSGVFILPPHGFALTSSREYFRMPRNVRGVCWGKSTYARCGLMCHVTPLEAGWEGNLTIEISNQAPVPMLVYAHEGLCQIEFAWVDGEIIRNYADKAGKYMGQQGITAARAEA